MTNLEERFDVVSRFGGSGVCVLGSENSKN